MNAIKNMISNQQISKIRWYGNGMESWSEAGTVSELSGAFGSVPPPLPPQ